MSCNPGYDGCGVVFKLIPCGTHDFIGLPVFQESVHVDAGTMRERIQTDDGLIGWGRHSEQVGDHAAGAEEFLRFDSGAHSVVVGAGGP